MLASLFVLQAPLAQAEIPATEMRDFALPAGPADQTLKLFSAQSSRGLLVGTEAVRNVRTNEVNGRYPAADALKRMLLATGLEASEDTTNGAFVVRRRADYSASAADIAPPRPGAEPLGKRKPAATGKITGRVFNIASGTGLANASVRLVSLNREVATTPDGEFHFSQVPAGEYTLAVAAFGQDETRRAVRVTGGGETHLDLRLGDEVLDLGRMTVGGEREGQARALQQKRMADNILEVVSADSAGKLPDGNAAEAVRRLPGVFTEIDQNEGRFIVVRGIDSNLNNVTINGVEAGSPGAGDRGTQMDAVPADLISRIEVIKAVTPDMDAQGIGAAVNIVTPSAFDRTGPFAYGTLSGGIFNGPASDRGRRIPSGAAATIGTQFGDGKWGLVVGGSYSYRHYISNRRSGGGIWFPAAASGAGADILFPATQALFYYDVQRWRQGLNASLEYRPDAGSRYFLRVSNNAFKDDEGRDQDAFEFYRSLYPAGYTPTTAHFSGGRSSIEYRHFVQQHRINNYSLGGRQQLGDADTHLDYTLSFTDTGIRVPERLDVQFRTAATLESDLDASNRNWRVTPEPAYYDLANYPLRRVLVRTDDEAEDISGLAVNLRRDRLMLGRDGYWQLGAKYLDRAKSWRRQNKDYAPAGAWNLGQFDITAEPRTIFDGYYPMTRRIDFDKFMDFFRSRPDLFAYNEAVSTADSYANFFEIDEKTLATYAMARVNFGRLSVLGGIRAEDTRVDVTGIEFPSENGAGLGPRPYHGDGHYTNLLPGVHLRYAARKNWILRAAWTNTIGRPSYADIGTTRNFTYTLDSPTGPPTYTGSITDGNANLKPYEAMNFDAASEFYFQHTGILSIGVFHKRIRDPVYDYTYTARNVVFAGKTFSSLTFQQPLNAEAGWISGLELSYQQQLKMLPAPFDGLGLGANLTFSDSGQRLPTRPGEELPFAKQAPKVCNLALFYEKGPCELRLAYTYTGAYVMSYGVNANGDDYRAARRILDAKVSWRLGAHLTCFADMINFGQTPLDEYAGYPGRSSATERYWWTANLGIHWRY